MRPLFVIAKLAAIVVTLAGCAADPLPEETRTYLLGETEVQVAIHLAPEAGLRYLVLHDDENTAVEAALATIRDFGGRLIEVRHTGERNVGFAADGTTYRFDPNRIFTDRGAAATLERLSEAAIDSSAIAIVRSFADSLLSLVTRGYDGPLITVHNNTPDGYSVRSYESGGEYSAEAHFIHVAAREDVDDFVFTTSTEFYHAARDADLNAVLQRMPPATDDGSLPVYAALDEMAYVNVEAEHGHFEQQVKMLALVVKVAAGALE